MVENKIKVTIGGKKNKLEANLGNTKRGGVVTDEQVEKALEEYFVENPVKDGEDGGYYKPRLESDGTLIFTPSKDNMLPIGSVGNIKGQKGDKGDKGDQGEQGIQGIQGIQGEKGADGEKGTDGKSAYAYAQDGGYEGTEEDFAKKLASGEGNNYVTAYGAKGDGITDDTQAFVNALAENRVVHVPGGTYKLTSGIIIEDNSCLELSQDTVLNFTNTSGNCITLNMISSLKGNHATVNVPYDFDGNVIYANSIDRTEVDQSYVPPFTKWSPQWKSGRYVTDINICKADSRGFHYAVEPEDCKGNAVYLTAKHVVGLLGYMWGINFSGLRIAGAFKYGIYAKNVNKGWMHEMRVDAFIDACEIGVCLEDCNNAYISAVIQPRPAYSINKVEVPYAKYGILLIRSKNADLSGSRVWDWNADTTLWTDGGEYQHIAMIGECRGAILNDFYYYETSIDIRKQIYTDYASNLSQMTILQEPIDRWFKVTNGAPYYNDGFEEHMLVTSKELNDHFDTGYVKYFTDVLPKAIDKDGSIYNEIGYRFARSDSYGDNIVDSPYYVMTGFIPCSKTSTINAAGFSFDKGDDNCRIIIFDSSFNYVRHVNRGNLIKGSDYFVTYTEKEDGFSCTLNGVSGISNAAYVRFIVHKQTWTDHPMIAVNEAIEYTIEGFLADGIKVKGENVIGNVGEVTPDWVATKTPLGGDEVYISQQTLTSGLWSKLQINLQLGVIYDVHFNGEIYPCLALNEDGGIYLGNVTLMDSTSTKPHNNEPFCVYWAGAGATGGFFYKDKSVSYPITLKVTDHGGYIYNKMPKEYLPEEAALKTDIPEAIDGKDGKDGADGERGYSVLRVTTALSSYTTTTGGFTPKYRIALSTVLAESGAEDVRIGDTILRNYYTYRVGYVDSGYVYTTTYASIRGSAGTSVTITDVTESTADGGSNVVTFSDGKTLTVKNGKKGNDGDDYILTEADKNEIAQKAAALVPGGGGSGGGTSIDVTAEVGQTIIVKEVDANGKPTKWESADYQPRTHWDEGIEVLPETEGVLDEEMGLFVIGEGTLVDKVEYIVTYNGAKYTCKAIVGESEGYLGNMGGDDESLPNSGEPFLIANFEGVLAVIPFDGAETVKVAIVESKPVKIPNKFLPTLEEEMNETILPETEGVFMEEEGFYSLGYLFIESGKTYIVTYNGVEYVCALNNISGADILGNAGALDEALPNTGEPFAIVFPDGLVAAVPLDGAETVKMSIKEAKPIPQRYLTNAFPYYFYVKSYTVNGSPVFECNETVENLVSIYKSGRPLVLKNEYWNETGDGNGYKHLMTNLANLSTVTPDNKYFIFSVGATSLTLESRADGSFAVSYGSPIG